MSIGKQWCKGHRCGSTYSGVQNSIERLFWAGNQGQNGRLKK